jgi:hypothetical protein
MCSSLNIVFNLNQNTSHYIAENYVRPAIDFKIIRLARVRFEFETPAIASASRPAVGPTQPSVQWVPRSFPRGGKARPGRDADHSPPSSAEVKNELKLYLLSPQAPPWRVAGLLYLYLIMFKIFRNFTFHVTDWLFI